MRTSLILFRRAASAFSFRSGIGERGLCRLLHYVSKMTGKDERAFARSCRGLHMENFSADLCPSQACGHTDLITFLLLIWQERGRSQELVEVLCIDFGFLLLSFCHFPGYFSTNRSQFPLEISKACLLSILRDHLEDGLVRNLKHLWIDSIFFHLSREGESFGDLQFLQIGISREVNHFHPIFEGRGNGIGQIPCGNEHYPRKVERDIEIVVAEGIVLLW